MIATFHNPPAAPPPAGPYSNLADIDLGATFADVVNIRTHLADMDRRAEYREVRRRYLADPLPTSTTVEVSRLFRPGLLLEVDITAAVRGTG